MHKLNTLLHKVIVEYDEDGGRDCNIQKPVNKGTCRSGPAQWYKLLMQLPKAPSEKKGPYILTNSIN